MKHTHRQTDRQTDIPKLTDIFYIQNFQYEAYTQTDRQAGRHTKADRHILYPKFAI